MRASEAVGESASVNERNWRFETCEDIALARRPHQPLYCYFPTFVRRSVDTFLSLFPGDTLFAVKSSPLPFVLADIARQGISNFDIASQEEFELVRTHVRDPHFYFMNPVKSRSSIERVYSDGATKSFAVDHLSELEKLSSIIPASLETNIFVRLAASNKLSAFDLSTKFGADPATTLYLLNEVGRRGFTPGVCFHVGSQCVSPNAFHDALRLVKGVVEASEAEVRFIDVGGGFPGDYDEIVAPELAHFVRSVSDLVHQFGLQYGRKLLCEPGRAITWNSISLITQVHMRKDKELYLNDGVYGSLLGAKLGLKYRTRLVSLKPRLGNPRDFGVYGPTCDSLDRLSHRYVFPDDIAEGDWVIFDGLGSYSTGLRTGFNGFYPRDFEIVEETFC